MSTARNLVSHTPEYNQYKVFWSILVMTVYALMLHSKSHVETKWIYATIFVQFLILIQKSYRNLILIFLPLNLYASGPFLASHLLDINKYPFPTLEVLTQVAYLQTLSTYWVLFLCIIFRVNQKIRRLLQSVTKENCAEGLSIMFPVILLIIALSNFVLHFDLIINFSNLQRHNIFESLNLVAGPLGIAFGQVASLTSTYIAISSQRTAMRILCISALAFYWAPILLSGSRQYFVVFAVSAIMLLSALQIFKKSVILIFLSILVGFVLAVPILFGYSANLSYNEFIFPSQLAIQVISKNLDPQAVNASSVFESWVLVIPGFLRSEISNSWSSIIGKLTALKIGVGGSPWIEWFNSDFNVWVWSSALGIFFVLIAMFSIKKVGPLASLNLISLSTILGRTFFWNMVVIIVGVSIFASIGKLLGRTSVLKVKI